jgi:hypothetical protein
MNRDPRNKSLLASISSTNPFRETLAPRIFAIGNDFEKAVADVGQDGRLSQQGKREKARGHLEKALRDLDAAQGPIADYRKQTASLRSGMKTPSYDRADSYAAGLRRELRDLARTMTPNQRAGKLVGPDRSVEFIDALCELPVWASGVNVYEKGELEVFEEARQSRLRDLNGDLMTALEARASVESEIAMVVNMVRNDLESDATDLSRAA